MSSDPLNQILFPSNINQVDLCDFSFSQQDFLFSFNTWTIE